MTRPILALLVLAIVVPERTFRPAAMQVQQAPAPAAEAPAQPAQPIQIPLDLFKVPDGFEVTLWAATPMLRRTLSGSLTTLWPATAASPSVGRASVVRMRIAVVFPAPFEPISVTISPRSICNETPCSALIAP